MTYGLPYVEIDPARLFGKPCIGGTRIPTRDVADLVWYGTDFEEVLKRYGGVTGPLDRRSALVALWYEAVHGSPRERRKAWREWQKKAGEMLWHANGELPDPPPSRAESQEGKEETC